MSPLLKEYLNKKVVIVTTDGHSIIGVLEGYDKSVNMILSNVQSNYDPNKPTDEENDSNSNNILSIQVCRGSEIVFCGLVSKEQEEEKSITLKNVTQWDVLKTTKNIIKDEFLIWKQVWLQQQKKVDKITETA